MKVDLACTDRFLLRSARSDACLIWTEWAGLPLEAGQMPASATLIEKHVRQRTEKAGLPGARRGKEAAALDAAGAALGSLGLAAFGLVTWLMIVPSAAWALVLAAASWLAVAVLAWQARRWL
jgi:hypothetical protein